MKKFEFSFDISGFMMYKITGGVKPFHTSFTKEQLYKSGLYKMLSK
jgi:hypothetical protein